MENNAQFRKDMTVGLLEKEKAKEDEEKAEEHETELINALAYAGLHWNASPR